MSLHVHQLDRNIHTRFLAEGRQDPTTKETLKEGNRIVICAGCKVAHLADSWEYVGRKCVCGATDTMGHVPERLDITQSPPRLKLRLPFEAPLDNLHSLPDARRRRNNFGVPVGTGRRFFEYGIIGAAIGLTLRGILTGGGHLDDWLFNYYDYIGLNDKDIDRSIHILPYGVIISVFLSLVATFYLVYRVIKK